MVHHYNVMLKFYILNYKYNSFKRGVSIQSQNEDVHKLS